MNYELQVYESNCVFDLPVKTKKDRREYSNFRKYLVKSGFMMIQESVYSKLALNQNVANGICDGVKNINRQQESFKCLQLLKSSIQKWKWLLGQMTVMLFLMMKGF